MKRERGTALIEELLKRVTSGGWPLDLVDEVRIFGSYRRGALQPHDVDIDIDYSPDDRWAEEGTGLLLAGRDPEAPLRRALNGGSRSLQIACHLKKGAPDIEMLTLWRRGETLEQALRRLHAIRPEPTAGRAERDAMLPAFVGLEQWLIRPAREWLVKLVEVGAITVAQFELADAEFDDLQDADAEWAITERWNEKSPLRRAAIAALLHLTVRGISPLRVRLQGQDIAPPTGSYDCDGYVFQVKPADAPYFVDFKCRYLRGMPRHLTDWPGGEWIEIPRPTLRQPLLALRIVVRDLDVLAAQARELAGF